MQRLTDLGVSFKVLCNIKALYSKTDYTIRNGTNTLGTIASNLGLKQGCPLSPLLFNLYISDFPQYLQDEPDTDVKIQDTVISHFFYADDLVILSDSKEGLQNHLKIGVCLLCDTGRITFIIYYQTQKRDFKSI